MASEDIFVKFFEAQKFAKTQSEYPKRAFLTRFLSPKTPFFRLYLERF